MHILTAKGKFKLLSSFANKHVFPETRPSHRNQPLLEHQVVGRAPVFQRASNKRAVGTPGRTPGFQRASNKRNRVPNK